MLYFFRLLLFLINVDQEIGLKEFGMAHSNYQNLLIDHVNLSKIEMKSDSIISLDIIKLSVESLYQKVQEGLTLVDIENLLFFILFTRFIILALRYNLKTSFYITCIGLFAGYLWYRHLIDLISMYRGILMKVPYLHKLGIDAVQLLTINREMIINNFKSGENIHWYNPGKLIFYAFTKGIIHIDLETGLRYYIDPISMIFVRLKESDQTNFSFFYYKIYNKIIPQAFEAIGKLWNQLSGIAAYAVITRIGKRYCPYLVRWHWTFLLIIGFIEQILVYFVYRISYFQSTILIPNLQGLNNSVDQNLILQINILNGLITLIVSLHLSLIFFGLFHASWGQYFYFPFIVENTELHIGPKPKNSIYSGGNTAWQEKKKIRIQSRFPQLWYGWFVQGIDENSNILNSFQQFIIRFIKQLRKQFGN